MTNQVNTFIFKQIKNLIMFLCNTLRIYYFITCSELTFLLSVLYSFAYYDWQENLQKKKIIIKKWTSNLKQELKFMRPA